MKRKAWVIAGLTSLVLVGGAAFSASPSRAAGVSGAGVSTFGNFVLGCPPIGSCEPFLYADYTDEGATNNNLTAIMKLNSVFTVTDPGVLIIGTGECQGSTGVGSATCQAPLSWFNIDTGEGNDVITLKGGTTADIDCGPGNDKVRLYGRSRTNFLRGCESVKRV